MHTQVPLSLEHTAENGASRFATALKRARLEKRWKQEDLANKLHVTLRAVVSWETGARIPSSGMVFLLCMLFIDDAAHEVKLVDMLRHDLLVAYLVDDLRRQTHVHVNEAFHDIADRGIEQLSHLSEEDCKSEQEDGGDLLSCGQVASEDLSRAKQGQQDKTSIAMLQQFFTLFEQLREHPELIAVVHDFLRELV